METLIMAHPDICCGENRVKLVGQGISERMAGAWGRAGIGCHRGGIPKPEHGWGRERVLLTDRGKADDGWMAQGEIGIRRAALVGQPPPDLQTISQLSIFCLIIIGR